MEEESRNDKMGNATLVLGVVSLIFCCVPILSVICGIIGIVLAGKYEQCGEDKKLSLVHGGKVCCILGIIFACVVFAATLVKILVGFN